MPISAKKRAVIRPWLNIWSTAPVPAVVFIIKTANNTSPQCDTEE